MRTVKLLTNAIDMVYIHLPMLSLSHVLLWFFGVSFSLIYICLKEERSARSRITSMLFFFFFLLDQGEFREFLTKNGADFS